MRQAPNTALGIVMLDVEEKPFRISSRLKEALQNSSCRSEEFLSLHRDDHW
jgi:hypothetical protein